MVVRLASAQRPNLAAATETYSGIANGDVVDSTSTPQVVQAVGNRPKGIVVDDIPTDNPPQMFRLAVSGDVIEDTSLTSETEGALVYSDGDGTYSTTEPNPGVGSVRWILGHVRESDATSTIIELDFQALEDSDA